MTHATQTPTESGGSHAGNAASEALASALRGWYGPGVAVASAPIDACPGRLPPAEAALVATACAQRRAEFVAGRMCARRALAELGGQAEVIGIGPLRGPEWPTGFLGSIAHDAGFAAAAVTGVGRLSGLGIDLHACRSARTYATIARQVVHGGDRLRGPPPRELTVAVGGDSGHAQCALVFAAKEAAVKVISPIVGRYLSLSEFSAVIDGPVVTVTMAGRDDPIQGRWAWIDGAGILVGAWLSV